MSWETQSIGTTVHPGNENQQSALTHYTFKRRKAWEENAAKGCKIIQHSHPQHV